MGIIKPMKHTPKLFVIPLIALALPSCSMNPLFYGYRSAPGVPKREMPNPNPRLVETSMQSHNANVDSYSNRGFRVIGYGDTTARQPIDAQNARLLAIEKDADVAIFSSVYGGMQTERVAVPVAGHYSSDYSSYSNSNNDYSSSSSNSQSTVYEYQNRDYEVWHHKTTLLRGN
ncbi:MAG: hypothetical protein RLZ22_974 [Verrucomicrobiota bacterium]|jgi:hypothetical protein